jgi:imidazolonepropionase-like amidohydrolase
MFFLRAARLFDGLGSTIVERPLVAIDGGRIAAVDAGAIEPPADAEVLDFGDATLLPGLIDAHVHLGFDATADSVAHMCADSDATLLLRMRQAAQRALAAGITTVRDLGDRNYLGVSLRDWFRTDSEVGPEIVAAGPPITITNGHCHFMGGVADGERAVRRAVREHVEANVDVIKIMATGGHMTHGTDPTQPQYTVAELRAAVDEAHAQDRLITAHAHGAAGISHAVTAGVDGLEHCSFRVPAGRQYVPELAERIAAQQIAVCPTVGGVAPTETGTLLAESFRPILAHMHRLGVRLVGGTDAGISPTRPIDGLAEGIAFLSRSGMSPAEALRAATSVAAEACGVGRRKGRLAAGWDADVLVVRGDPLREVAALRDVAAVLRAGRRYAPSQAFVK